MSFLNKLFKSDSSKIKWYKVFDSEADAQKNIAVNKAVTVQIEELKICLARTASGYHAVDDNCPHLGMSLSRGVCNSFDEVVCPWHAWRFDLKKGHETSGQGTGSGVKVYKVEMRDTGLYIGV